MHTTSDSTPKILLVSDPGLPTKRIEHSLPSIKTSLGDILGHQTEVNHIKHLIPVTPENEVTSELDLPEEARDVDYAVRVLLTEMPLRHSGRPVVAQMDFSRGILIISCPTMGVLYPKRRLVDIIGRGVESLVKNSSSEGNHVQGWNEWGGQDQDQISRLYSHTWTGGPRTVAGMVMSNQPWKTIPRLSSALTAASAAGAFGIFYSSIWEMAESLSGLRLAIITLVSILVMTAWLILRNRLWDAPVQERLARVVALYNISTVVTLLISIASLYLMLFVLILLGGLVVIDPDFMQETLGMPTHLSNYLNIAWLSASMGVIAGGLGSGFDSETDLQRLTHGQRERQRVLSKDKDED
ncbi:hypothetical protein [Rothia uropygialis]|uniref:hypothetical protein n=1 Tax=Kocuria sp. 36 TaxID=1415402 RepID=UPI00101D3BF4|nr:hypothetical protein [Kocuria sp. 36]